MNICHECGNTFGYNDPESVHYCVCDSCLLIDRNTKKRQDEEAAHHEQEWIRQQERYYDGTCYLNDGDDQDE